MFFFGSLFPTFFLDKFGRRRPMIVGSLLCGISMLMIAALLSPQQTAPGTELANATSKGSVAFFFTVRLSAVNPRKGELISTVHVGVWCNLELRSLGIRPRDLAPPRQGERDSSRDL